MKIRASLLPSAALLLSALACGPAPAPGTVSARTPAAAGAASPVVTAAGAPRIFAVVLVPEGSTLKARTDPGNGHPMTGSITWDAVNLGATGNVATVDTAQWVELRLPEGGTGWVERKFLTEYVPPAAFCQSPTAPELLGLLGSAVQGRDGIALAAITSPVHGLTVTYIHNGAAKVYPPRELETVFESRDSVEWGLGPGSGLPVTGPFSELVAPDLEGVFGSEYALDCNAVHLGGASYDVAWPAPWRNINFYSVFRAGPPGNEMDWMTWLAGIETVDGVPYLFSLSRYNWEP